MTMFQNVQSKKLAPCSLPNIYYNLNIDANCASKASITMIQSTRYHIPEDNSNLCNVNVYVSMRGCGYVQFPNMGPELTNLIAPLGVETPCSTIGHDLGTSFIGPVA
jgi:hypothetical protein